MVPRLAIMEWLSKLGRRLLMLVRSEQFDQDLEEEILLHPEVKAREQIEAGVSADEGHYAAERQVGNTLLQLEPMLLARGPVRTTCAGQKLHRPGLEAAATRDLSPLVPNRCGRAGVAIGVHSEGEKCPPGVNQCLWPGGRAKRGTVGFGWPTLPWERFAFLLA